MSAIKYDTDQNFPFQELHLANPTGLQGGAYFSKLNLGEKKVIIQMPKCETKNGIHRTGKKIYTDLKFLDSNETFSEWMHNLSTRVKSLIYEKKDIWFQSEMTYDDIEYHWQNILRTYKKNYVLLRCIIKKPRNINRKELVMVYDEDENIISLDAIKSNSSIIPLLEITGLKFTRQSFLLEFALKQVMVLNEIDVNECLISVMKHSPNATNIELESNQEVIDSTSSTEKSNDTLDVNNSLKDKTDLEKNREAAMNRNVEGSNDQTSLGNLEETKDENTDNKENINDVEKTNVLTEENVVLKITPFVQSSVNIPKEKHLEKEIHKNSVEEINSDNSNTLEKKDINEIKLEYPDDGDTLALKKPNRGILGYLYSGKTESKRG